MRPQLLLSSVVSTKLEVSTSFIFQENQRHGTEGRTDRRTGCNTKCGLLGRAA